MRALLVSLLGIGTMVAPAAHAVVAPADVLVVLANDKPVATRFASEAGHQYTFVVTGLVGYNGLTGLGLSDCGHYDPEGPTGWVSASWPEVDGTTAQCAGQPTSPAHTYTWSQRGTGAPFVVELPKGPNTQDDFGGLVVVVSEDDQIVDATP